jgi:hypothetical protein
VVEIPDYEEDEQTMIARSSALSGAFNLAVSRPSHTPAQPGVGSADEWYVGINGVPVGPIRLSELRSKASSGAVTKDSLVWRDGFEDWKPLGTFPELVAIIEESLSSVRGSVAPLAPSSPPAPVPAAGAPPTAVAIPTAVAVRDPFAAPSPRGSGVPLGTVTGSAVVTESSDAEALALVRRRGTPAAAWFAVVVAVLFGATLGVLVLMSVYEKKPVTVVKYVEVPAKAQATAAPESSIPAPATDTVEETSVSGSKPSRSTGTRPKADEPKPLTGLSGLSGLQPGPQQTGPSVGDSTPPAGGGQGLDSSQLERTVSRYKGAVKRRCWQPALDTRAKDAPTSARVSATITIGPSGSVQNVTASGDPNGYRGLSACISSSIRTWQFPASGGVTTAAVPFVFAAQ